MSANAQKADLQEFVDGLGLRSVSRADDVTEIDLANYSFPGSKALEIHGGIKVKFINGTLQPNSTYDGTILKISDNSYVELAETAAIKSGPSSYSYTGLVKLSGGTFRLTGGDMLPYKSNYAYQEMIDTDGNSSNILEVESGEIYGTVNISSAKDQVNISGGSIYMFHAWDGVYSFSGDADIHAFASMNDKFNITPAYTSPLKHKISFQTRTEINKQNEIAFGKSGVYELTQSDVEKMSFIPDKNYSQPENWELYLEDNCVKVREKIEGLELKTADDLQALIDKIAKEGNTDFVNIGIIDIPEEGIIIDKPIDVKEGTFVKLTGGPIKVADDFDKNTGADFVFTVSGMGMLKFEDITYDGNSQFHHYSSFLINGGNLTFGENVIIKNLYAEEQNSGSFIEANGHQVFVYSGEFNLKIPFLNCNKTTEVMIVGGTIRTLENKYDYPAIKGEGVISMLGGTVEGLGVNKYVIEARTFGIDDGYIGSRDGAIHAKYTYYKGGQIEAMYTDLVSGSITGSPSLAVETIYVSGSSSVAGDVKLPKLRLQSDTKITITSALQYDWTFSADWSKFELEKSFLLSNNYTITKEDFAKMTFLEMPSDREAYYDEVLHTVQLREKKDLSNSDDLQSFIDGLAGGDKGTSENPVEIVPSEDGLDIDKDVDFGNDLQAFIDGLGKNGKENKVIRLCGGNVTIGRGSCLTFRNLQVDGCEGNNHIYVHGTLIIDVNIYIRNFREAFVHVMPGGKIIWRGGDASGVSDIIRNEGGTVEIEGGKIVSLVTPVINISGTINIYYGTTISGTTTSIINGLEGSTDGIIVVDGGIVNGGIINYGSLTVVSGSIDGGNDSVGIENYGYLWIDGGYISGVGGSRSIWTKTDIYLCGCTDLTDIFIAKGVKIYITAEMSVIFRVHFIEETGFEVGKAIIEGADGYVLTDSDCEYFVIPLPDNYRWSYDKNLRAVIISDISGIDNVVSDDSNVWDVYSLKGIKVGKSDNLNLIPSGIYIINGKKIYLK